MLQTILLCTLAGSVFGTVVNWLADYLPRFARSDSQVPEVGAKEHKTSRRPVIRIVLVYLGLIAAYTYVGLGEHTTAVLVAYIFYLTLFMLVLVIDIEHRLVLDSVMLPAFALALFEVLFSGRIPEPIKALAGYAVGQIIVMTIFVAAQGYLAVVNRNRDTALDVIPFGFGDVTLVTFCGLVLGYPKILVMLFLMVIFGGIFAIGYALFYSLVRKRYTSNMAMPYAPAVISAATIMLVSSDFVAAMLRGWSL
nr:prepilin peptidase [Anaerolineae bacterium]